jgi:hypothetical protein
MTCNSEGSESTEKTESTKTDRDLDGPRQTLTDLDEQKESNECRVAMVFRFEF